MTHGGNRRGAGRKKIHIDLDELEKLCRLQCTDEELAAHFGISIRTIERRRKQTAFRERMERGLATGRISVRRMLFSQAAKGNTAASIFLAKNLHQTRKRTRAKHRMRPLSLVTIMFTGKRLEAHLAWTIHGRKTPHQATSSIRRGPPRDEAYKAWIRALPCVGCGVECQSEAAHTGEDGGMSMKASDYSCVPLCRDCHTLAPGAYHRIGKKAFEEARGLCLAEVAARLQRGWRRIA